MSYIRTLAPVLMEKILILLLTLTITESLGQSSNRFGRITKQEFQELLIHKDKFVPIDLTDTLVIIRYSGQRLIDMQNKARNISLAKNGADTIGLKSQSWRTEKQIKKSKIAMEKFAHDHPVSLKKVLKKKGIESVIVDENMLTKNSRYSKKYWLKTIFVSEQESLEDNGWIMTSTNMFYDPQTSKDFELFLPLNYSLIRLIE